MEEIYSEFILRLRADIYRLIREKEVDIDKLSYALGISRDNFILSLSNNKEASFYLEVITTLEHWGD